MMLKLGCDYNELGDLSVDHINGNRTDNRMENLRLVTHQENCKNKHCENGYFGIKKTNIGNFTVDIGVDGEYIRIGTFGTFEEAKSVRKDAEAFYGFHANHGSRAVQIKA